MPNTREKLIELVAEVDTLFRAGVVGAHLAERGVKIPVRCKDCKHYVAPQGTYVCDCFEGLNFATDKDFCSYGERREGE